MFPIIAQYKMITIGTYGITLGLAFYLSFLLTERELRARDKDDELAYKLLLAAIPSAIVGAKIFHILENLGEFARDPRGMIFSGAGLSVYGGMIMAVLVCLIVIKMNNERYGDILDIVAPAIALGYGIGRLGCHVSGDGCYGIETESFLGTPYPNGIVPHSSAVFPTPLFESMFSFLVFIALMKLRKGEFAPGRIFFLYLFLNGLPRFLVEFIRLNPSVVAGLTQAQLIAICIMITGIIGWIMAGKKAGAAAS